MFSNKPLYKIYIVIYNYMSHSFIDLSAPPPHLLRGPWLLSWAERDLLEVACLHLPLISTSSPWSIYCLAPMERGQWQQIQGVSLCSSISSLIIYVRILVENFQNFMKLGDHSQAILIKFSLHLLGFKHNIVICPLHYKKV